MFLQGDIRASAGLATTPIINNVHPVKREQIVLRNFDLVAFALKNAEFIAFLWDVTDDTCSTFSRQNSIINLQGIAPLTKVWQVVVLSRFVHRHPLSDHVVSMLVFFAESEMDQASQQGSSLFFADTSHAARDIEETSITVHFNGNESFRFIIDLKEDFRNGLDRVTPATFCVVMLMNAAYSRHDVLLLLLALHRPDDCPLIKDNTSRSLCQ